MRDRKHAVTITLISLVAIAGTLSGAMLPWHWRVMQYHEFAVSDNELGVYWGHFPYFLPESCQDQTARDAE